MSHIPEADLAETLGVPLSTGAEWRKKYAWPHVRIGRRIYYTPEQVAEITRRHTVAPKPKKPAIPGQTERSASRAS